MRKYYKLLMGLFAVVAVPVGVAAQATGTITGQVTERTTGRPLPSVTVQVVGSQARANTNAEGRYNIQGVPAGAQRVSASLIGFDGAPQNVTVVAGQTATANFALAPAAVGLEELVVTATGETQRRREVGNAVSNINVARDVQLAAVPNMASVLQARSPGVSVLQSGGTTGTGARVRIRGSNSLSLSNEPLLIIDGVRVNNAPESFSIGVGGQSPSRLNDINPEDIENIEVLKGPAAAALYGTAAANGVIQVTTKRGRAGRTRYNAYAQQGTFRNTYDFPANYGRAGMIGTSATNQCTLDRISTGACVPASSDLLVFSPLQEVNPFRTGRNQKVGLGISGGVETATYYVSGDYENEQGIYANNDLERVNLRGNIRSQLRENLDITVTSGYLTSDLGLPQNDNNLLGYIGGALLGRPVDDPDRRGYAGAPPSAIEQLAVRQGVERFTGGLTGNWRPLSWLSFTTQTGLDVLNRHDNSTTPQSVIFTSAAASEGSRTSNRVQVRNYTANTAGTATFSLTPNIVSTTTLGTQFQKDVFEGTFAFGANLLPGTRTLPGTSARFAVNEQFTDNRTIGVLLSQQFGLSDRLFITGTIRGDDNSAFGSDFGFVTYPSLSAAWTISEEGFFPESDLFSFLKLRAAYGESGLRPNFRDAISFFSPVSATVAGVSVPTFTIGGTGNPNLRPERSREIELGFDTRFFGDRLNLEVTGYDKLSNDALVFRRLAPSTGVSTGRFENIGSVRNRGLEVLANVDLLNQGDTRLSITGTLTRNRNTLVELGEGIEPIIFGLGGASQRHQEGFPLGSYWGRQLRSFEDTNGDSIITRSEVVVDSADVFLGNAQPTREFSVSTNASYRFIRLNALVDGKGGYLLNNSTVFFRCASAFVNCQAAFDRNSPLEEQARVISGVLGARGTFYEDASFVKLREVSVTLGAPEAFNRRLGLQSEGLSLTLAGRNLKTWTGYTGFDPEINFAGQENFSTAEFLSQPPLRTFTARVNVNF